MPGETRAGLPGDRVPVEVNRDQATQSVDGDSAEACTDGEHQRQGLPGLGRPLHRDHPRIDLLREVVQRLFGVHQRPPPDSGSSVRKSSSSKFSSASASAARRAGTTAAGGRWGTAAATGAGGGCLPNRAFSCGSAEAVTASRFPDSGPNRVRSGMEDG